MTQSHCKAILKPAHSVGLMCINKNDCHRKIAISAALRPVGRYSRIKIIQLGGRGENFNCTNVKCILSFRVKNNCFFETKLLLTMETTPMKQFLFFISFILHSVLIQGFMTLARDITVNDLNFIALTSPLTLPRD